MSVPDSFSLSGNVWVVTEATGALGRSLAITLAGAGSDVYCSSRTPTAQPMWSVSSSLGDAVAVVDGGYSLF